MKKDESKNIIILFLIVIIVILVVLVGLFATNTISFNYSKNNDINNEQVSNEVEESTETNDILTSDEAEKILVDRLLVALDFFDNPNTYCGTNSEISDKIHESGNHYYKSNFSTYNDMKNYLSNYMTEAVLNTKSTFENKNDYYIEENNQLYCLHLGKGGAWNYDASKNIYTINNITSDTIEAIAQIYYDYGSDIDAVAKTINVKMQKNNNIWQISLYEVQ